MVDVPMDSQQILVIDLAALGFGVGPSFWLGELDIGLSVVLLFLRNLFSTDALAARASSPGFNSMVVWCGCSSYGAVHAFFRFSRGNRCVWIGDAADFSAAKPLETAGAYIGLLFNGVVGRVRSAGGR